MGLDLELSEFIPQQDVTDINDYIINGMINNDYYKACHTVNSGQFDAMKEIAVNLINIDLIYLESKRNKKQRELTSQHVDLIEYNDYLVSINQDIDDLKDEIIIIKALNENDFLNNLKERGSLSYYMSKSVHEYICEDVNNLYDYMSTSGKSFYFGNDKVCLNVMKQIVPERYLKDWNEEGIIITPIQMKELESRFENEIDKYIKHPDDSVNIYTSQMFLDNLKAGEYNLDSYYVFTL